MISLVPITDRLKAGGCARAEGVMELAAIGAEPRQLPAFYAVPTDDGAQPNTQDAARDQAVDVRFSVFVMVDAARRNQAGVSEQLKLETDRARDALLGWTHPEASRACAFAGGRLVSVSGPAVTWEVRFIARMHLRRNS